MPIRDSSVLTPLLFAAILAIVVLVFKYAQLQSQVNDRVQQHLNLWKSRELDGLRAQFAEAARAEAGVALHRWRAESEAEIRADAVRRSSAVVSGKVTEHLTPYMGIFPYNPKDVRFLGSPVDLVVFDGLSEDALDQIVFLEIKTGASSLTTRERRVRDVVLARQIVWKEFRVGGA
jgi:predicted Holliday junction resolvase-like endonuclease